MKLRKNIKKIIAIGFIAILGATTLVGCSQKITQEDIDYAVANREVELEIENINAIADAVNNVDLTQDNDAAVKSAISAITVDQVPDAIQKEILKDYKEAEDKISADDAKKEAQSYLVDDVSLTGNFNDVIDSDDFYKLSYIEVELDDEDYIVEEKVYISEFFRPILNMEDLDGEVALEIAEENAIRYAAEFDSALVFDDDETVAFSFLGIERELSNCVRDTITFTTGNKQNIFEGSSITVENKTVTATHIRDDRVRISVEDEDGNFDANTIKKGHSDTLLGLGVYVSDVIDYEVGEVDPKTGKDFVDFVELKVGKDVEVEVSDGEDYSDDNEMWGWYIPDGCAEIEVQLVQT